MVARALQNIDRPLLITVMLLAGLGTYNLASAGQPIGEALHLKHLMHLGLGSALGIGVMLVHYRRLEAASSVIFGTAIVLLLLTATSGKLVNGSRRWLELFGFTLQTSDLAKLATVVALAHALKKERFDARLTLREVFRPLNVSRPVVLIVVSFMFLLLGDRLSKPTIEQSTGKRFRPVARISVDRPVVVMGRHKGSGVDLGVDRTGVAERHASISRTGNGTYVVTPLGKEKTTFLNDTPLKGPAPLRHGDKIRLGPSVRAKFRFSALMQVVRWKLPLVLLAGAIWLTASVLVLHRKRSRGVRDWVAPIDVVALPAVLILGQPDLGTAIVVGLIGFTMIFYVGLTRRSLWILSSLAAVFSAIAWIGVLQEYQKERVLSFLNPSQDLAGSGYHQHQSLIAIGSGQAFGKGHGQGTQTQFSFVPEQHSDFIFPVWAEEHGFFGALLVMGLLALMMLLSIRVAQRAWDRFGALLAVGMAAVLFWHTLINLLMVLRFAPVVGVPLPFWSAGGSFVVTTCIAVSVILSVSIRRTIF